VDVRIWVSLADGVANSPISMAEMTALIIVGCIPSLPRFYKHLTEKSQSVSHSSASDMQGIYLPRTKSKSTTDNMGSMARYMGKDAISIDRRDGYIEFDERRPEPIIIEDEERPNHAF
jgi:hypothetical protein